MYSHDDNDGACYDMPPGRQFVTRAAKKIAAAKDLSVPYISPLDTNIYNNLIISLINRLHRDRNKLFHLFSHRQNHYYCVNRKWYHYYEWMFHCNRDTDVVYATVGEESITICDLYLRDTNYVTDNFVRETRGFYFTPVKQMRKLFCKMEKMKQRSPYWYY